MRSHQPPDALVVGAGIIGLTTALRLTEAGRSVRIWAKDPTEHTTSAVAGALWTPYRIEPKDRVTDWSIRTLHTLTDLAEQPDRTGVRLVPGTQILDTPDAPLPDWAPAVPTLRRATPDELPAARPGGYRATLPLIDMPTHLRHLTSRLAALGVPVEQHTVTDLQSAARAANARHIVNCTGLGARDLIGDPAMTPVQGQLVVVENPGLTEWFVDSDAFAPSPDQDTSTYVFPQPYGVVLGGTARPGTWGSTPDQATAEAIVRRCAAVFPKLAEARVLDHRIGLRPARSTVRLEAERLPDGTLCVHNYGHGGAGVTTAWACADDVVALLAQPPRTTRSSDPA